MSTQSRLIEANYPSESIILGAGVAIFHLSTARVVVCHHPRRDYWFLPKGRKNANEDVRVAAEREGFEESGYRNRLLPLPHRHCQTEPDEGPVRFSTEALWIQLRSTNRGQYILHWYAAETLPPAEERDYIAGKTYQAPTAFPKGLTLAERIELDGEYEPVRHEGTGVNEDEALYESHLMSVEDALKKLGNTVMAEVVRRAWQGIELRKRMETA